jgi:outer membrane receptor protein involved in Fe transport
MKHSRNPLYQAVQYALVPGAMAGLAITASPVLAQDAEEEAADLDRVQVTGSRISRIDIEGANPVTVLDRDDIKRTGMTDLGEVMQNLPMMSGSPTSTSRNNGGSGRVAVDIRGLGTNRTLVLVNGNRMPALFNDFSLIPTVMVERIEILKDGASAIYGADAVAGVVNIITRRDFEGAEFEFQVGESFDHGGMNWSTSFITGGNSDRGNFVVGVEYTDQEEIFLSAYDEDYLNKAVTVYDAQGFHELGFSGDPWVDNNGNGYSEWLTLGSSRVPYGRFDLRNWNPAATSWTICRDSAGQGSLTTDYGPRGGACNEAFYNFGPANYIQTPYERSSFFFQADYELFDGVNAYMEAHFANRTSEQLLAPLPYDTRFDPSYSQVEPGVAISKDNYYNPFGVDVVEWRRRMVETGGRSFKRDIDQWQTIVGLQGDIGATWTWDLSFNFGKNKNSQTDFGQFNGVRLGNALGPSFMNDEGNIVCGTPDSPISGCVSMNAFTNPVGNPITQDMLDYVSVPLNDITTNERQVTNLTLVGDIFELPGGPLSGAFGFERRKEKYAFIPDSAKVTGQTTGNVGAGTVGKYDVDSFFGEINIPIVSGVTGAEMLEVGISGRYDDFSIFESSTTWQGAIRWQPVRSLLLRATAGQVYREPNVSELFAGQGDSFPNTNDPCSGIGGTPGGTPGSGECEDVPPTYVQTDSQARARVGGNMNVTPEEGDTLTVGMAWSPTFAPGFSMTLDWWRIEIDDAINIPSSNVVLSGCFSGSVPGFCDNITRFGPETTQWGNIDTVLTLVQKVGPETAEGIDWSANYSLNSGIGLWNFSWFGTYNKKREQLVLKDFDGDGTDTAEIGDVVGLFEHRSLGRPRSFPEWRWRFDTDWALGDWGVSFSVEFIDTVVTCGSPYGINFCEDEGAGVGVEPSEVYIYEDESGKHYYLDLVGRYTIPGWGTQISAGVTNLTDKELPFINQGFNATTDEDMFRAYGRSWFVNIKHSF